MIAQEKGGIPRRPFTKRLSYLSYIPKLSSVCAQPQVNKSIVASRSGGLRALADFLGARLTLLPVLLERLPIACDTMYGQTCKMMVELISLILASHGIPRGHLELQDFDVVNCSREPSLFPVKAN